jgi:hypothetical protein
MLRPRPRRLEVSRFAHNKAIHISLTPASTGLLVG